MIDKAAKDVIVEKGRQALHENGFRWMSDEGQKNIVNVVLSAALPEIVNEYEKIIQSQIDTLNTDKAEMTRFDHAAKDNIEQVISALEDAMTTIRALASEK